METSVILAERPMAGVWFCTRESYFSSLRQGRLCSQGTRIAGPEKLELGTQGAGTRWQGIPDLAPGPLVAESQKPVQLASSETLGQAQTGWEKSLGQKRCSGGSVGCDRRPESPGQQGRSEVSQVGPVKTGMLGPGSETQGEPGPPTGEPEHLKMEFERPGEYSPAGSGRPVGLGGDSVQPQTPEGGFERPKGSGGWSVQALAPSYGPERPEKLRSGPKRPQAQRARSERQGPL